MVAGELRERVGKWRCGVSYGSQNREPLGTFASGRDKNADQDGFLRFPKSGTVGNCAGKGAGRESRQALYRFPVPVL